LHTIHESNEGQNAVITERLKSRADKTLIKQAFSGHFIFNVMDDATIKEFMKEMVLMEFEPDVDIVVQDTPAKYFFIIRKGKVDLRVND
jgi:signal-transduction protein with cAMP-binding, CBS, and nucleotidyltransferase domain